jgi:predicted O-methyltransferase YrrM
MAVRAELRRALDLGVLPPRVAWFQWRAHRLARRLGDEFSLISVTRPADLAILLDLAAGRERVVELGTATAWTAISLALADARRAVVTYDPIGRPDRGFYLRLVGERVRERISIVDAPGASGPREMTPIDLLYVDSTHELEDTLAELRTWQRVLRTGALVILDDYTHPHFPGVKQAVERLGLSGHQRGTMFVHEVGG